MTDVKKDNSWYDIWKNWMVPEAESNSKQQIDQKEKDADWHDLWSSWMAPEAIDNKKEDEKE